MRNSQTGEVDFCVAQFGKGTVGYSVMRAELDGDPHVVMILGPSPMAYDKIGFAMAFPTVSLFDEVMANVRTLMTEHLDKLPLIKSSSLKGPEPVAEVDIEVTKEQLLDDEIVKVIKQAKQMLEDRHAFDGSVILLLQLFD
jgi:hypothetical protein